MGWGNTVVVRDGISASGMSVWYDGNVHYAYASAAKGDSVVYRTGTIDGNLIVWQPELTVVQGVTGSVFLFSSEGLTSSIWALKEGGTQSEDSTTSVLTGTKPSGTYITLEPGQTAATSASSLPGTCTRKGWRSSEPLQASVAEGTWAIQLKVANQYGTSHSGKICVRLWKSEDPNLSQAQPLTDWVESTDVKFSPENIQALKPLWIIMPPVEFKNEYLFIELAWKVTVPSSTESAGLNFDCAGSQITTVSYEYYNAFCTLDSNGLPWVSFFRNDGFYWEACITSAKSSDGTSWNTPTRLSEPSISTWRACILPLNEGKMYALYSRTEGVKGKLWDGTTWGNEENVGAVGLVQDYGFSAVSYNDDVHLVMLQNTSLNVMYFKRSSSSGWAGQVLQANQGSESFPVLSVDKNTSELYCFWLYQNTLYMKRYSGGAWESSNSTPLGTPFATPRGISCFYQVSDNKIGIAWIEKPPESPVFTLKYGLVHIQPKVSPVANQQTKEFFMYATQGCGTCQKQLALLRSLYGEDAVKFYDIDNETSMEYYRAITESLVEQNVFSATDPNRGLIPVVGYLNGGSLKLVTLGPLSQEDWLSAIGSSEQGAAVTVVVGSLDNSKTVGENDATLLLADTISQRTSPSIPVKDNLATLIPLIGAAAAIDAINPCELNAFLILLVYVFYNVGKKQVLKIGIAFSAAVFISYYLLGLGALRVFQSVPQLKFVIVAVGLTLGALEVLAFFGLERKHVPNSFAERIRESLKKAANPYTAFIAGVLVSLLLLPCTSGSYFVALDLLAKNATFAGGLFLLTLYNAIVVLPFVALTVAIYTLTFKTAKLRVWLNNNEKWLRLFGGVTLIFVSLMSVVLVL